MAGAAASGDHAGARFRLCTDHGEFSAETLVVATGGLSAPTMGASGFGYDIARQFGHTVLPTRAGLVPFTFSDDFKAVSERLSGLALEVTLSVPEASFRENMLFTHRGLSGRRRCNSRITGRWARRSASIFSRRIGPGLAQDAQKDPSEVAATHLAGPASGKGAGFGAAVHVLAGMGGNLHRQHSRCHARPSGRCP